MKNTSSMKNFEFRNVYKNGKSVANNLLILYTLESAQVNNKLGICASKTVGNSVFRHRATRLIRESYRLMESKIKTGRYIVIVARKNINEKNCMEVKSALCHLLKKSDLLIND